MAGASYINAAEAASIRQEFRNLEATIEAVFWDVHWTAWTKDRPETGDATSWNKGTAAETWKKGGTGAGRLRPLGGAGFQIGNDTVFVNSGYVIRLNEGSFDTVRSPTEEGRSERAVTGASLVIEGRLFIVDDFQPRGGERTHAYAGLTEVFDAPLPVDDDEVDP